MMHFNIKDMIKKTAFLGVILGVLSSFAHGAPPKHEKEPKILDFSHQEARDFVELVGNKIIKLLQNKNLSREEQEGRYRQILNEHFDMPAIALYTLGPLRKEVDPPKQKEFIKLFTQVIVENYVDQFKKYKNQTLVMRGRDYPKGSYLVIPTYIDQKGDKNIDVQWYVKRNSKGTLSVYELVVEGVGLKKTKRNIYASTLRQGGIDKLIQDLRQELGHYNK